jgi:hypothetical protein
MENGDFPSESVARVLDNSWPKTIQEALSSPDRDKWLEALKKELKACIDRKTFRVVEPAGGEDP